MTVTVTAAASLTPPAPLQEIEKAVVAPRVPVLAEPLLASSPFQPPAAEHAVALAEFHESVALPPGMMEELSTLSVTVGTMLTLAEACGLVPPAPLQIMEKVELFASAPVLWLPLVASAPPHAPEALQLLAPVEDHVTVACSPSWIVDGETANVTVGTAELPPFTFDGLPQAASNKTHANDAQRISNCMKIPETLCYAC
jgi:hypothetical protein